MIKDLIREEIEEAKKEEPTLKDVAKKLGVPMKEEQVTTEGLENLDPQVIADLMAKLVHELWPAIAGGAATAAATSDDVKQKVKDFFVGSDVADDPRLYDDED